MSGTASVGYDVRPVMEDNEDWRGRKELRGTPKSYEMPIQEPIRYIGTPLPPPPWAFSEQKPIFFLMASLSGVVK